MLSGILDKRIKIYRDVGTAQSARGQHVESWELFLDCCAGVVQIESGEAEYGSKICSMNVYSIIIRYNKEKVPNTKMVIEYEGLKLNIASAIKNDDSVVIRAINKDGDTWQA